MTYLDAARAMLEEFRHQKAGHVAVTMNEQRWGMKKLSVGRLRQIVDGYGQPPSADEWFQLRQIVTNWMRL